ncbi:histidinol-phosphate transaminase [Methylomonas koyamae]|uniref:Histidinol-phosphate aminotransferase n=1 Tax=Methylomonas koyamae TaxID=702114 RepID=A0A291IE38_9GAMM|nr:histidinol-phosphate transaminase [Methylomonas koyamae]ATG88456.1 histidinol-phosphate aminotransferase [Methylomonas koyamae]OAI24355.1 histidinol-phosphate aminotransferase [Methylomonas koyamae]
MPLPPLETLFRREVLAMSAYHVADASNYIKLDAMENPYSWPDDIQQAWLQHLKTCPLNRYPDPEAKVLADALRRSNAIPETSAILLGNGSDEIIQILLMALPNTAAVLAPEPGFVMYKQIALSLGLRYRGVPLAAESFDLDLPAMLAAIEAEKPAVIFLAYPNNPTGNLFDPAAIEAILAAAPGLVVVDEAYAPFADASFIERLAQYDNLLVMRTVSKLGLAGLRLGFMAGPPALLEQLNKVRLPYNINCLTQATAGFALEHPQFLLEQTRLIREQRGVVMQALQAIDAVKAYPSAANFILFRTLTKPAGAVFAGLKQQGVLIKNLSAQGGLLENCLRATIGKPEENQAFLQALKAALA